MRVLLFVAIAALVAGSCSSPAEPLGDDADSADSADSAGAVIPAPRTITGSEIDAEIAADEALRADQPQSALPPQHLNTSIFPEALIDRTLIVSGGPPPDGIPAIDAPTFTGVDNVDWLDDSEAVLVLELDGDVRVYPTQILVWHEIVNDDVNGHPVAVTYCPLCNSGLAFERAVQLSSGETELLDFGTSGSLYQSAMVMYDRQTESLWTHFDGRAVVGDLVGTELERLPLGVVSWSEARTAYPAARVLERPGLDRDYGRNPYVGYDQSSYPIDVFFNGAVDPRLEPMARVVGLEAGDATVAITLDRLSAEGVLVTEIGGQQIVLWHEPGLASSLEAETVAGGSDIGTVAAFATDESFSRTADGIVDDATGSTWNVFGTAERGPREGEQLSVVAKIDTFWFAWSTYHPATTVVDREGSP